MKPITARFDSSASSPASRAILRVVGTALLLSGLGGEHVARAAHRMQQRLFESLVELSAKAADMDVDNVGARVEVIVPHLLQQHRASDDPAFVAGKIFEQQVLARLEVQLFAGALYA